MMLVLPGDEGQFDSLRARSFAHLLERLAPRVATTVRSPVGARLGDQPSELPATEVELMPGAQTPDNPLPDFLEPGIVWKTKATSVPAEASPIEARPLLAGRAEQAVLQKLLQTHHQQTIENGRSDLEDSELRQAVARVLLERADRIDELAADFAKEQEAKQ